MSFLARVVRFLFWLLVLSWDCVCCAICGRYAPEEPGSGSASRIPLTDSGGSTARRLVRDPVCGLHVDATRSIRYAKGASWSLLLPACRDA